MNNYSSPATLSSTTIWALLFPEKKISVCATDRTCGAGRVRLAAAASSAAVAAVG